MFQEICSLRNGKPSINAMAQLDMKIATWLRSIFPLQHIAGEERYNGKKMIKLRIVRVSISLRVR